MKKRDNGSSHFMQLRTLLRQDEMAQGRVPARLALHFSEKIPRKTEDVDEMEYSSLFLVPSTKLNIVDAFFFVWRICTPFIHLFCKTDFRCYLRVTQNKLSKNG